MIISGIFIIYNKINNHIYYGSSVNLLKRKDCHFHYLRYNKHQNMHLQRAYNKYGRYNFEFQIILECRPEQCLDIEQVFLNLYCGLPECYNMHPNARNCLGTKRSPESIAKQRAKQLGKPLSMAHRHSLRIAHLGFRQSEKQILQKSKSYALISTTGQIVTGTNICKFCRDYQVDDANIRKVISGKYKTCQGWTKAPTP